MSTTETYLPRTEAVIALSRAADRTLTIHALDVDGARPVGTFATAAEAWAALDELDLAA